MKVIVKSYKPSGKWYHTEETQIELRTIDDVLDLEEKIKRNDESIQHLSGLKQGFSPYFTYMVELKADILFMNFVIHSDEFIRISDGSLEKQELESLKEQLGQTEVLKDDYFACYNTKHEDVQGTSYELKEDNEKLKKQVEVFTRQLEKVNKEVITEKEKNATQRQKNEKLEQVLADVNNIMDTIVNGHHFTDDIEGHLKELAKMAMQKINEVTK